MPEFSITFCCAHVQTMFKYVVLWYAEEISLSLSLFFFDFVSFLCFFSPYVICLKKNKKIKNKKGTGWGMAAVPAQGTACLSLRNGCRCVPEAGVTVEDLLVAVGQKVGFDNIISGSRMNKAVVVFLKAEALVNKLTVDGLWVKEAFVPVSPLSAPATKITISNVPPFVSNVVIIK